MSHGQRVLIVDEISDTEEVLRAVLEPRGLRVDRCTGRRPSRPLDDASPPTVMVIDTEVGQFPDMPRDAWQSVPQVLIGTARLPELEQAGPVAERHYFRKPFHYAELIQTIERIIGERPPLGATSPV